MSYDLAVWEGERPGSAEEAAQAYEQLAARGEEDSGESPSPCLLSFARDLTARYPEPTDLPVDRVDESPWAYGPLSQNIAGSLLIVGVRFEMVDEVLPFISKAAREHGLVSFDLQERALVDPPAKASAKPDPKAKRRFLKEALEIVAHEFEHAGYTRAAEDEFHLRLADQGEAVGEVSISRNWVKPDGAHAVRLSIGVVHLRFARLYEQLTGFKGVLVGGMDLVTLAPRSRYDFAPGANNEASAREMVEAIEVYGRPHLERLTTLDAITSYIEKHDAIISRPLKLPVALALQGRREKAKKIVSRALSDYDRDANPRAEKYRAFAARFFAWLDARDQA